MDAPRTLHHAASQRVFRFVKCSPGQGLIFPSACPDTRKSITDAAYIVVILLFPGNEKKQQTISRSSPESEDRAVATE